MNVPFLHLYIHRENQKSHRGISYRGRVITFPGEEEGVATGVRILHLSVVTEDKETSLFVIGILLLLLIIVHFRSEVPRIPKKKKVLLSHVVSSILLFKCKFQTFRCPVSRQKSPRICTSTNLTFIKRKEERLKD